MAEHILSLSYGEIWEPVKGFEGYYEVSNMGRVRSVKRFAKTKRGGRNLESVVLKPQTNNKGYLMVNLRMGGERKNCTVHRLVANAFLPNPGNLPMINHKDENKENNRFDNLEWCTAEYNQNYGSCPEKKSKARINAVDVSKPIIATPVDGGESIYFPSTMEAVRNGYSSWRIIKCCRGESAAHKGYKWEYVKK